MPHAPSASSTSPRRASETPLSREQTMQAFTQQLHTLAPHHRSDDAFRAFVDIAALTIHQSPYHLGKVERDNAFDRIETAYLTAVQPYSPDALAGFVNLYRLITLALAAYPATDLLGRLYMTLGMGHPRAGHYFTPPDVARAMTATLLSGARARIEQQGFVTLADPACGAGAMLIEAANELHSLGYDPKRVMMAQAVDHSRDCFNMAYLQLSLLHIPAVVIHGDSLTQAVWERRPTPMLILMTQAHRLSSDPIPTPPMGAPTADSTQKPPDIAIPSEQLHFYFDGDAQGV